RVAAAGGEQVLVELGDVLGRDLAERERTDGGDDPALDGVLVSGPGRLLDLRPPQRQPLVTEVGGHGVVRLGDGLASLDPGDVVAHGLGGVALALEARDPLLAALAGGGIRSDVDDERPGLASAAGVALHAVP